MKLHTLFKNPYASPPVVPKGYQLDTILDPDSIYEAEDPVSSSLLFQLYAKGDVNAYKPWAFDLMPLSCNALLYSVKGSGTLTINGMSYTLPESSLLFFDCNHRHKLQIESDCWDYKIYMFGGIGTSAFTSMLPSEGILMRNIKDPSLFYSLLDQLDSLSHQHQLRARLQIADIIHRILTMCSIKEVSTEVSDVPEYLSSIKYIFDNEYAKEHSLDELEAIFHVSKYRICHEFKEYYHMPPLQYLNWRRIEAAKVLLTSTTYKVHEISNMVGIENTNHFINQFKKYNQFTPSEFKRSMLA